MTAAKKTPRKRCRLCDGLATVSRDVCTRCQMAEVRSHIKRRGRAGKPDDQHVQAAYGKSLATLEHRRRAQSSTTRNRTSGPLILDDDSMSSVVQSGVTGGFDTEHKTLAYASLFSVAMGKSQMNLGAAALFYSYGQKTFYRHIRAVMESLPAAKMFSRKRKNPSKNHDRNPNRLLPQNQLISRALRLLRIYMHEEIIPLALKLGCGKTGIWNIESCHVVVQPHWVEAYSKCFGFREVDIWRFAEALGEGPAAKGEPRDMIAKFVDIVLRSKEKN